MERTLEVEEEPAALYGGGPLSESGHASTSVPFISPKTDLTDTESMPSGLYGRYLLLLKP